MAEFCLDCWNELNESNDSKRKYIISKDLCLCEGCGENKHVIIMARSAYYLRKLRYIIFPFKFIYITIYVLWRLMILPYLLFKHYKQK